MTGTCVKWWTFLCVVGCKKPVGEIHTWIQQTAPQHSSWEASIKETKSLPQQGPLIQLILCWKMISLTASFTKAHYERRRLPTLMLKHCSLSIYRVYGIHNTLHLYGARWKASPKLTWFENLLKTCYDTTKCANRIWNMHLGFHLWKTSLMEGSSVTDIKKYIYRKKK